MGNTNICKSIDNECLFQILNSNFPTCPTEPADNIPQIQMISEGLILLNNVKNTKVVDIKPMMIEGTALIRFAENVTINNTVYFNKRRQIDFTEPHPPTILNITT